jgi:REP element-mobilizing transposase RayT
MAGRKRPIHLIPFADGDRAIIVSVTVVTQGRQRCLAHDSAHTLLRETWNAASFWLVGRYVIMPDHIHFFCAPTTPDCSLERWMQFWKSQLTKAWPVATQKPVFQREHWDRQLRSDESYDEKWEYVRQNPVRAGLVTDPDAWPYQGELNELRW